jgi:cellulose biosynthesis protein BcsQ
VFAINLKGGVGKTTVTGNIAATYCRALNKRVLAIDLDFQASLTNLCLPADRVGELQVGHGRLIDNVFADSSQDLARLAYANMTETICSSCTWRLAAFSGPRALPTRR